jgi:hypothetical protein
MQLTFAEWTFYMFFLVLFLRIKAIMSIIFVILQSRTLLYCLPNNKQLAEEGQRNDKS